MDQELHTVPPARPRPEEPLLATKLYVPALRPRRLSRRQLLDRVSQGCAGPLLLVSSPAGFGKTTLLGEWVRQAEEKGPASPRFAWLSLDTADNDPRRFCRYLVAALQTVAPAAGEAIPAALNSPQPPPLETVATILLNDLCTAAADEPNREIVLVLDDYHLIDSAPIHDLVSFLVDHLPAHLHLVIATRTDPPLPLSLWRARGQMLELRADDLRFNAGETESFLNQVMALHLAQADVAVLAERTEGWIVGLQMAALSLQGRGDAAAFVQSFRGSHRFVLDYLLEQVLNRQPPEIQEFLLQTSILERMTAELCDEMLDVGCWMLDKTDSIQHPTSNIQSPPSNIQSPSSSLQTLAYLDRSNLFLIPLDDERRWYRYHHLFADLLRARLQQAHPESIPLLHRRASAWFEQNGLFEEAIHHAIEVPDYERAAVMLEDEFAKRRQPGRSRALWTWIEHLPEELVRRRPLLCSLNAIGLLYKSRVDEAEALLDLAGEAAEPSDGSPARNDLAGAISLAQSIAASLRGDVPQIVVAARRALDSFPPDDPMRALAAINLGNAYLLQGELNQVGQAWSYALQVSETTDDRYRLFNSLIDLGRVKQLQARLLEAEAIYRRAWQAATVHHGLPLFFRGLLKVEYGGLLRERNDLAAERRWLQEGIRDLQEGGHPSGLGIGYVRLGATLLTAGDLVGAIEAGQQAEALVQRYTVYPDLAAEVRRFQAQLCRARGDMPGAEAILQGCADEEWWQHLLLREWIEIAQAGLLVAQDRPEEALGLLERKAEPARVAGRGRDYIDILLLRALAKQALGEKEAACRLLAKALAAGQEQGLVRIFLDQGAPLAALLRYGLDRQLWETRRIAAYAQKLLAAGKEGAETGGRAEPPVGPVGLSLPEPLSERELQVLRLLAAGLSNQDIARELVLTVGTVKTHVHNVYGKLGVESRTQAVAKGRGMGVV